jgi:beta-lactamase regulating signal transducer with metallopeptidase domain
MLSAISQVSTQAASAALTALWQGALLVCGLALCLRVAPRTSASHRFLLWAAAFMTLVSLTTLGLISGFASSSAVGSSIGGAGVASSPWLRLDERWSVAIALLWAAASIARGVGLGMHAVRLRTLWKTAVPVALDGRLQSLVNEAWGRGVVEVCTTAMLERPSVIGFFKPRILMPEWLFARLTAGELEQIVLHEGEHLRRRDDWTNLLQKICLVLFPLNPALVWMERRLGREREMACDDGVVSLTHAPRAYAACLASLAERGLKHRSEALTLGAWQRRPELVDRVHSILRKKGALGPVETRVIFGALSVGLVLGGVELSRCPQLVAFVPSTPQVFTADAAQPSARMVNAAYYPDRNVRAVPAMMKWKAAKVSSQRAIAQGNALNQGDRVARGVEPQNGVRAMNTTFVESDSQRVAKVANWRNKFAAANEPKNDQQQWFVLTTWESVQTTGQQMAKQGNGVSADYDVPANVNEDGSTRPAQQAGQQPTNQITVTRLIVRVIPASEKNQQSTLQAIRDGWLVLQL